MEQPTQPQPSPYLPLSRVRERLSEISISRQETTYNMSGYDLEEIDRWRDRASDAFFSAQVDPNYIPIALHAINMSFVIFKYLLLPAQRRKMERAQARATRKYAEYKSGQIENYSEVFNTAMEVYDTYNQLKTDIGLSVPLHKKSSAISALEENIET